MCVAVAVAEAVAVAVTEAVAEANQPIHNQSIHDPSMHPRSINPSTIHPQADGRAVGRSAAVGSLEASLDPLRVSRALIYRA